LSWSEARLPSPTWARKTSGSTSVRLNGQYEGKATGETFNGEGKTDVLIRHEGGNIFIAECKFWRGEKAFLETIDQVLSYLSWRDTKAALSISNKNRDFSSVLAKIKQVAPTHIPSSNPGRRWRMKRAFAASSARKAIQAER
jgi:hypothetical protein